MFQNSPLSRRFWSGLDDKHLASIGFANFAWNNLERKFASLIWVTAGWSQEVGELVTADLGNVSAATLFINLLKQSLRQQYDPRILDQATKTAAAFDGIRTDRNDMIHCFFDNDPTQRIGRHIKLTAKNRTGEAEIKTISMSDVDINQLCDTISHCFDSMDDLIHKLYFRRQFLGGERGPLAQTYEQAVHDWRAPSFDIAPLQMYLRKRSQRLNPQQGQLPPQSSRE